MKKLHEVFRFDEMLELRPTETKRPQYGADYTVKDPYHNGDHRFHHYKIRTWKDLSTQEKRSELAKSTGKLVAGLALVGLGHWFVGETGHNIPDAEFDAKAKADVTQMYMGATALDKFEMNYLMVQETSIDLDDGGSMLLGDLTGASAHEYYYGQDCLADTGYNTNPSLIRGRANGQITAAASLAAREDGGIGIYPAGSTTPPLVFQYSDTGVLLPDAITARTLEDQDCNTTGLSLWDNPPSFWSDGDSNGKRFSTTIR